MRAAGDERLEVGEAEVAGARGEVVVHRQRAQRRVAAGAAARDQEPVAVDLPLGREPRGRVDAVGGVDDPPGAVQPLPVLAPEPGAPPVVHVDDREPSARPELPCQARTSAWPRRSARRGSPRSAAAARRQGPRCHRSSEGRSARTRSSRHRSGTRSAAGRRSWRRSTSADDDERRTSIDLAVTSRRTTSSAIDGPPPMNATRSPSDVEPRRHRGMRDVEVDQLAGPRVEDREVLHAVALPQAGDPPVVEETVGRHAEDPLGPAELRLDADAAPPRPRRVPGTGSTTRFGPRRSGGRRPGSTRAGRSTPRPLGRRPARTLPRRRVTGEVARRTARTRPTASRADPIPASRAWRRRARSAGVE